MITAQTEDLLQHLRVGVIEPSDTHLLEGTPVQEFLAELECEYRFRFQERELGQKREIGLAHSLEFWPPPGSNGFHSMRQMIQVFHRCVFLSIDDNKISGISVATELRVEPISDSFQGRSLAMGKGNKLDCSPDGWDLKPQGEKTVKLSDEFLQKRGWQFDALEQSFSKS